MHTLLLFWKKRVTNEVIFMGIGLNCGYKTAEQMRFNLSCFLRICAVSFLLKLCLLIKLDPFFQISPFWSSHHHGDTAAGLLGNFCPIMGRTMTSQFIILACRLTSFLEHMSCILCFLSPEGLSSFLFTVWFCFSLLDSVTHTWVHSSSGWCHIKIWFLCLPCHCYFIPRFSPFSLSICSLVWWLGLIGEPEQ